MIPVFVTNSPHLSQTLYFISNNYLINKSTGKERKFITKSLREELKKKRPNLSDQDINQLKAELNVLSKLIIDSYLDKNESKETI